MVYDLSYGGTYDGAPHGLTVTVTEPETGAEVKYGTVDGTYDLDASPTVTNVADGPLTVYYQITAANYKTVTGSVTLQLSRRQLAPAVYIEGWDYGDTPNEPTVAGNLGDGEMSFSYAVEGVFQYSPEVPTEPGTYRVRVIVMPTANYTGGVATRVFTITGPEQPIVVTYDANDGKGAPKKQEIPADELPMTLSRVIPVREGWNFLGWAESADAADAAYLPGSQWTKETGATLYAVWSQPDFILPAMLTHIEEEAFAGSAFRFVLIPEKTEEIQRAAFADCPNLRYVLIPAACASIDAEAFGSAESLVILGEPGSAAATFAAAQGFAFVPTH